MNSFNHYAYGAVAEWFYSGMCGIKPDTEAPGWEHFFLAPTPDMDTTYICHLSQPGHTQSSFISDSSLEE